MTDVLSLSAGSVLDLDPDAVVYCAADAGYECAGVRLDDPVRRSRGVARALATTGLTLLDVEVARLGADPLTAHDRALAGVAADLGARFLLTVVDDPDEDLAVARLAELAACLAGSATRVALEPMAFTGIRSRAAAERVARAAGVTVLLDPLHLHRMGDTPGDPELVGYAQLTDVAAPGVTPADLAHEARHERVPPGHGGLDLVGFLGALPPDVPLAVEVQSDRLWHDVPPRPRAVRLRRAAEKVVAAARESPTGGSA